MRRCAALTLATGLAVTAAAAPAGAVHRGEIENNQAGLIDVGVVIENVLNDDTVTVQVPIAVALTLCDVDVDVLGVIVDGAPMTGCESFATSQPSS